MTIFGTSTRYTATFLCMLMVAVKNISAANILTIIPVPSYSHQQPLLKLSYALAAKGHNLTILTANPSKKPIKNVREIDLSSLYDDWKDMQAQGKMILQSHRDPLQMIWEFSEGLGYITAAVINKPQFKEFIREVNGTKYDLILYEAFLFSSLLGIREIIGKPPSIGIGTVHQYMISDEPAGNPFTPSYIPSTFLGFDDRMTLYERFVNLYTHLYSQYVLHWHMYPSQQQYLRQAFGDLPYTAKDLEYNKSLLLVSVTTITGYPKPLQPNTIYVGPLHVGGKAEPLPQELQKWMDEAEDGVIYFSLGSNMKGTSVPAHIREAFINAFKQFPKVRVLWKWEADTKLPGQPDNVLVRKWLPQKSILAHPNLKVFISQVGLQSLQEAIDRAVPILGVPLFADQFFNMKRLSLNGAGLGLTFSKITYEEVYEKLKALLTDPRYKENMLRISTLTKDQPMSPIETAIWWVEYVLRHNGAPHLRPASLDLTWYQYYMLDILLIITILVLVMLFIFYFIAKKLIDLFSSNFCTNSDSVKIKKN